MGNWVMHIDGHGVHDNDLEHDAEARLKQLVDQMIADGHTIHHATITVGPVRKVVPSTPDAPAHYVYQP